MKKKILVLAALILTVALVVILFMSFNSNRQVISPEGQSNTSSQQTKQKFDFSWTEWQDPAGFAFLYPQELEIDNHPEDETNYANLDLSSSEKKGEINIVVNDTQYDTIEKWLEQDESVSGFSSLETEIASASARKVALKDGKELAAFIDPDLVLYLILLDLDGQNEQYWREVYDKILDSFRLIPLEGESVEDFSNWMEGFNTTGADIVEPVEIIE